MRFQYRTLDGRISDARTIRGRFTSEFSVDATPVRFLGDPATVTPMVVHVLLVAGVV